MRQGSSRIIQGSSPNSLSRYAALRRGLCDDANFALDSSSKEPFHEEGRANGRTCADRKV